MRLCLVHPRTLRLLLSCSYIRVSNLSIGRFFFLGDSDTDICPVSLSLCVWVSGLASFLDSRCVSCGDDAHISSLADHVA